jgi:bacteriocin-like protein
MKEMKIFMEQAEQAEQVELDDSELQNVQGGLSKDQKIGIGLGAAGTHLSVGTITTLIVLRRRTSGRIKPV